MDQNKSFFKYTIISVFEIYNFHVYELITRQGQSVNFGRGELFKYMEEAAPRFQVVSVEVVKV